MFDMTLLSCVHILFVISPYPVDLVGHPIGRNKAMQQYLVVESLCVPQLAFVQIGLAGSGPVYKRTAQRFSLSKTVKARQSNDIQMDKTKQND